MSNRATIIEMQRLHSEQVAPEKMASFKRAISTKNPLALQSFEERGASIAAKVDRIQNNPNYQKMSPEKKARIRGNLYDKYVAPSYKGFHLEVPPKDAWVRLTEKEDRLGKATGANSFYENGSEQARNEFIFGVDKGLTGVGLFGLRLENKMFQKLYGMESHFSAHLPDTYRAHLEEKQADQLKSVQRMINTEKNHMGDSDVWLKSHYRDSTLNNLSNTAGEFVATLPLYEGIGGLLAKGKEAVGLGKATISALPKNAPLTAKLMRTPLGKWVVGTLTSATDGYLSSFITSGGDKKEGISGAITMGIMHGIGGPALNQTGKEITGRLQNLARGEGAKIASFSLIKKWSASILAMSGKPFAQDLTASAMHEEEAFNEHNAQTEHSSTPVDVGHGIVIKPATAGKGNINFQGVDHPYTSKAEKEALHAKMVEYAEKHRVETDPLMAKLHEAEKQSINSVARQMYDKPLSGLSKPQRARVKEARLRLIDQAAEEAPVHLPELAQAEVEHDITEELKANPARAERHKLYEKEFGEPVSKVVAKANVKKVALETGIINPKATIEKLNSEPKITKAAKKAKAVAEASGKGIKNAEYEPHDGDSVSFNALRQDSIAYFKKGGTQGRRASDGTLIGARDKRTWNEILKSDNLKSFISGLKEADRGKIKFENDLHRMLYHYANRDGLPKQMNEKLVREIKKFVIKDKRIAEKWTAGEVKVAADNTMLQLYELAKTDRLTREVTLKSGRKTIGETVYASTNVNPLWSPTQWQMQLHNENDDEQMQLVKAALKRHPKQLKEMLAGMETLVKMKYNSDSLDKYLELDAMIRDTARGASTKIVGLGGK